MKTLTHLLILLLILPGVSFAKKGTASKNGSSVQSKVAVAQSSTLSTDVSFDGTNLYGRYNRADEAIATVEDEKIMGRLLGLRMDFKDRLQAQGQQK